MAAVAGDDDVHRDHSPCLLLLLPGPISKVRWVGGDSHLITLSARDKTIYQWRHQVDDDLLLLLGGGEGDGGSITTSRGGIAATMKIEGEDEDAAVFDTEELLKQLQALESSLLPKEESSKTKNR